MADIVIEPGLHDRFLDQAAHLYFTAFWPKLTRILGANRLHDVATLAAPKLRADRAISAHDGRQLFGVAGFKHGGTGLIDIGLGDLQTLYGWWGGLWRVLALSVLERDERKGELLMDGICLAEASRGQSIGTRLLDAVEAHARDTGAAAAVRLDVIATNPRARTLYERHRFHATRQSHLGPLKSIFGFSSATEILKPLGRTE